MTSLLGILLLVNTLLYGQQDRERLMDSLLAAAREAKQDSAGQRLLERISMAYITQNPQEGIRYAQQALEWAQQSNNTKRQAVALSLLASNYNAASKVELAVASNLKALELYKSLDDQEGSASIHSNLSQIYTKTGRYSLALEANLQALDIYEALNFYREQGIVNENIANIYFELKDLDKSEHYYETALRLYTSYGSQQDIARCSGNMSRVFMEQKAYDKALSHLETARASNLETGNTNGIIINHINIGNVYSKQERYNQAIEQYRKALTMSEEKGITSYTAFCKGNIGAVYLRLFKEHLPTNPRYLDSARTYLNTAITLCDSIGYIPPMLEFMGSQTEALALSGRYKMAYEMLQDRTSLNDSLNSLETKQKLAELETQRTLDLKDKDLLIKEHEREIAELNNQKQFMRLLLVIIALSLILIVAFNLYRKNQRKHKRILSEITQIQSHEIRGPLATILGLIQLLKKPDKTESERAQLVKGLEDSAEQLDKVVAKIIQTSKSNP